MFFCGFPKLHSSIVSIMMHADDDIIKRTVISLLRYYAASTTTDVDDIVVSVIESRMFTSSQDAFDMNGGDAAMVFNTCLTTSQSAPPSET